MSKYYGQLRSESGEPKTKGSKHFIAASVQSFEGSVTVKLNDGKISLYVTEDSGAFGTLIGEFLLKDLLNRDFQLIHAHRFIEKRLK